MHASTPAERIACALCRGASDGALDLKKSIASASFALPLLGRRQSMTSRTLSEGWARQILCASSSAVSANLQPSISRALTSFASLIKSAGRVDASACDGRTSLD